MVQLNKLLLHQDSKKRVELEEQDESEVQQLVGGRKDDRSIRTLPFAGKGIVSSTTARCWPRNK